MRFCNCSQLQEHMGAVTPLLSVEAGVRTNGEEERSATHKTGGWKKMETDFIKKCESISKKTKLNADCGKQSIPSTTALMQRKSI